MSGVHFTDGFDRPDTIALGLDAPRLVTVVAGALCAYAVMQAPLPMALRVPVALFIAAVSALLGWGRYAGRPLLTWAWLALRFTLAPRAGGGAPVVDGATPECGVTTSATRAESDGVLPSVGVAELPKRARDEPGLGKAPASPLPPWAQWLEMEDRSSDNGLADSVPGGTVELTRDVPLVVMMDAPAHASASAGRDAHDVARPRRSSAVSGLPDEGSGVMDLPDGGSGSGVGLGDDADPPEASEPALALHDIHRPPDGAATARQPARPISNVVPLTRSVPVIDLPDARNDTAAPFDLTSADAVPPPVFVGAPRRVTFFSLRGGSGRTTLATEVACVLAARGRHQAPDGTLRPLRVALLDLDLHSATVAVRLGIAQPTLADYLARGGDPAQLDSCMVRHRSGAHVLLGPPKPVASGRAAVEPARVAEIVHRLERDGAHFVVIDVGADLGAVTTWVLSAAHDIFIVLTATASGVQDAYRSTEALRRLGLGHKLRYVVNRARGTPDLSEVMGDLGGRIVAVVPEDPTVEDAENRHRSVALDDSGPAAAALHDLAALLYPPLTTAARRTRLGWLPWRRGVG